MVSVHLSGEYQQEAKDFYESLGRTLSKWTTVEAAVFRIYMLSIGAADWDAAAAAYHCPQAFQTQLDMTNAAITVRYRGDALLTRWRSLHERCKRAAKSRNNLAHWVTFGAGSNPAGKRLYLTTNSNNPRMTERVSGTAKSKLYQAEIIRIYDNFHELAGDLFTFRDQLARDGTPATFSTPPQKISG